MMRVCVYMCDVLLTSVKGVCVCVCVCDLPLMSITYVFCVVVCADRV